MLYPIFSSVIVAALSLLFTKPAFLINGQVQDDTGKPAYGVRVCAIAEDFDANKPKAPISCVRSDSQGKFALAVKKASRYKLFYDDTANGHWPPYLSFFRQPSAAIPEVILSDEIVPASITISMLPKNGLLVGKSVDAKTGLPVENVEFTMCHAANPEICWRTNAKSAQGNFTVPAPHVPFTLRIKAAGFDDWLGPSGEQKETPMNIAPETKAELGVLLHRTKAAAETAISESEKVRGVNLTAPVQSSPANKTVFDYYPRVTKLKWSPVEGAVSYSVEVDYCEGGMGKKPVCVNPQPLTLKSNVPSSGILSTTYEFNFVGAQPGRWRVWALDKDGREGFKSPWRGFVYLR